MTDFADLAATSAWPVELSGCALADIGNYLLRALHVLASFAQGLLSGDVITTHIDERIEELMAEDDLQAANFVDDKHAALRLFIPTSDNPSQKDFEILTYSTERSPNI